MDKTKQGITLLLIACLATSILIMAEPTLGSNFFDEPPKFTVKLVDNSYDVPSTTYIDQYTGETQTISGYHVQNRTIEIKINNKIAEGHAEYKFYFYIHMKGHYGTIWSSLDNGREYTQKEASRQEEYTIVPLLQGFSLNATLDFQVKAVWGHDNYINRNDGCIIPFYEFVIDASTGWSNIHMLNMTNGVETVIPNTSTPPKVLVTPSPSTSPSSSPSTTALSPTATPTADSTLTQTTKTPTQQVTQDKVLFGFDWKDVALAVLIIIVATLTVTLVFLRKKSSEKIIGEK